MTYINIDDKIEILECCNTSREIYKELISCTEEYYRATNRESLAVNDDSHIACSTPYEINVRIKVLRDLNSYTNCVKNESEIPERLQYITPFWNAQAE